MPKKAAAPAVGPQHISYRKVPESLGGTGRVSLYDSRNGLPELLEEIPAALLKSCPWILVHFPSRRAVGVKTKQAGLAALKEIHSGEDKLKILPVPTLKKRAPAKTKAKTEAPAPADARATQPPVNQPVENGAEEPKGNEIPDEDEFTDVPAGLNFDQAMQHVFPVQRITRELEKLLVASSPIYSKEGDYLGENPQFTVRATSLRMLIEYHQGRPGEKEKPPQEKPRLSYEELVKWVKSSPAALEYMEKLCREAAAEQKKNQEAATTS